MQYLVEMDRIRDEWRLQVDGSWRNIEKDSSTTETDRRFDVLAQLRPFQQRFEVVLAGDRMMANPQYCSMQTWCHAQFRVIRDQTPRTPTKDELQQVIAGGDDSVDNTLVIDLGGTIRLKPWRNGRSPIYDLDIAVRMSTCDRGKGYIGREPAADGKYVDRIYRDLDRLWEQHVATGVMNLVD